MILGICAVFAVGMLAGAWLAYLDVYRREGRRRPSPTQRRRHA